MRESTILPLASTVPSVVFNGTNFNNETNRFGWSKKLQNETSQSFGMDKGLNGRDERHASPFSEINFMDPRYRASITGSGFTEMCKQEKLPQNRGKAQPDMMFNFKKYGFTGSLDMDVNSAESEENLNSLLKVRSFFFCYLFITCSC